MVSTAAYCARLLPVASGLLSAAATARGSLIPATSFLPSEPVPVAQYKLERLMLLTAALVGPMMQIMTAHHYIQEGLDNCIGRLSVIQFEGLPQLVYSASVHQNA